jgi:hypothetical protein
MAAEIERGRPVRRLLDIVVRSVGPEQLSEHIKNGLLPLAVIKKCARTLPFSVVMVVLNNYFTQSRYAEQNFLDSFVNFKRNASLFEISTALMMMRGAIDFKRSLHGEEENSKNERKDVSVVYESLKHRCYTCGGMASRHRRGIWFNEHKKHHLSRTVGPWHLQCYDIYISGPIIRSMSRILANVSWLTISGLDSII